MNSLNQKFTAGVVIIIISSSCMSLRPTNHFTSNDRTDPVCEQVVSRDSAITTEINRTVYYFDTDECRAVFLKNPEAFTDRKNTSQNHGMHWGILGGSLMVASMLAMMFFF